MSARKFQLHSTRGLVVRWVAYSNTSQIVHLFTRDQGLVSLLAKGSLRQGRKSSSFPVPFDLPGWYDVSYRQRSGDLGLATEARLIEGFDHLRQSLPAYLEACLALELMRKLFRPGDPHPQFLRGALSFLKLLSVGRGRRVLRLHFVTSLLREIGFAPEWWHCVECERPLEGGPTAVRLPAGGVCASCRTSSDRDVTAPTLQFLRDEIQLPWGQIPGIDEDASYVAEAWSLTLSTLLYHLESKPRSLRFLDAITRS